MTTAEYMRRLRQAGPQVRDARLAKAGGTTKPMSAHGAFQALLNETRGAVAHQRGVELPASMETPWCLLSPLI